MRVRIVSYEEVHAWILGKFALKLNEELIKLGIDSDIGNSSDPHADINHHIIYLGYDHSVGSKKDTLMITHIDDIRKLTRLKSQLEVAAAGICMSRSLMDQLILGGISPDKLCYINPAHDSVIKIKPHIIGIASQVKPDGCKREHLLAELSAHISPEYFTFKIMGSGWEQVNETLRKRGFQVIYSPHFDYNEYLKFIPSLDYYLYMGQDEGSMGYIDALAAGVKTIVTPQGFHLDAHDGIVYPFNTLPELVNVFKSLTREKKTLVDSVSKWTWRDYAVKHLEVWKHLQSPQKQISHSNYVDGLSSLVSKNGNPEGNKLGYYIWLVRGAWKRTSYKIRKGFSDFETFKKKSKSFIRNITK
jgi:hypothetical protein